MHVQGSVLTLDILHKVAVCPFEHREGGEGSIRGFAL